MQTKIYYILNVILLVSILSIGCNKNGTEPSSQASIPVLTTIEVSAITASSAMAGGNITSDGGAEVTARGVCWSTNSTPTIVDDITTDGTGTGSFSSAITGLSANITYNVRAYATNSAGTGYGNLRTFFTSSTSNQLEYLGQTPPGREFIRFAPNIVPPDMYHSVTISPDGQEIYWAARNGIMVSKIVAGRWTTPAVVSFSGISGLEFYDDAPVVSPDNRKLFFNSLRPYGSNPALRWRFWCSERTESGWSEPEPLSDVINSISGGIHWQLSVSNSGTLYFGVFSEDNVGIYYSRLVNGTYTTPEPLNVINNLGAVICPFIAPDESYIIFNTVVNGGISGGYYISFKGSDNQWLSPQRLVQFPSDVTSFVSRDGKYVFCKALWASAQIIEDLRP